MNGTIMDEVVFDKFFDLIMKPLKKDLEGNEIVIGINIEANDEVIHHFYEKLAVYQPKSISFAPTILLAAIGSGVDIADEYGTIVLNIGYTNATAAIIIENEVLNHKTINFAEEYLNDNLLIFFKEHFKLIISDEEVERVKYHLATVSNNYPDVQLVIVGRHLLTNKREEILVTSYDVKKLFTSLFANYRSMITRLLESSPVYVRTGIGKNGLCVTGVLSKIHGVKDYFVDFFEFPTIINYDSDDAVASGIMKVDLNQLKKSSS
jgi:rod shape-determining protein MreB